MDKILANKKILLGVIGGIIILLLLILVFYFAFKNKSQPKESKVENETTSTADQSLVAALEELKKLKVPEPGEITQEQSLLITEGTSATSAGVKTQPQPELAVPEEVPPTKPGSESSLRVFNLTIKNNKVLPKEIRAYGGDVVDINIQAVDKNYDFKIPSYGISAQINKGEIRKIQFQTTNIGKFTFECSLCSPKFKGLIVVVPR